MPGRRALVARSCLVVGDDGYEPNKAVDETLR